MRKEEDIRVDVIVTVSTLEWIVTCDKASPCLLSQAAVTQQWRLASMVQSSSRTGGSNEAQTNHRCLPPLRDQSACRVNEVQCPGLDDLFFIRRQFLSSFRLFLILVTGCDKRRKLPPLHKRARPWLSRWPALSFNNYSFLTRHSLFNSSLFLHRSLQG